MIKIEQINLQGCNLQEIAKDPNVFGIKESLWNDGKFTIERIDECELGKILSGEIPMIKIIKE